MNVFEERFECCICLDVFVDPVSTPCGHNFCKSCITRSWANETECRCPLCKTEFHPRPELHVNTGLRDVVEHFKRMRLRDENDTPARPGEVSCDVCLGTKLKALKSCLVCQTSYCETHLEPHQRVAMLKTHKLISPVSNLEDKMCKTHNRPLEFFCRIDQKCACAICLGIFHRNHEAVPLEEEFGKRKDQVSKVIREIQLIIQTKSLKVTKMKETIEQVNREAEKELSDSVEVFEALVASIDTSQCEIIGVIEEKQKAAEKEGESFIRDVEEEISKLQRRATELEQLSQTEDQHLLLQQSISTPAHTNDSTTVSLQNNFRVGTVRRGVAELQATLRKEMERVIREVRLSDEEANKGTQNLGEKMETLKADVSDDNLTRIQQQYAVDVTLDPETANPYLILSKDGKQVRCGGQKKYVPNSMKRFDCFLGVTGTQGFASGRFYYEVAVKGKTAWSLGVAKESIYRKGWTLNLLSPEYGSWTIGLRENLYLKGFTSKTPTVVHVNKPEKVGVFINYEEGEVSFYDVGTRALIHSFTGCAFSEKLFPFLSPSGTDDGKNTAPLIITPVNCGN